MTARVPPVLCAHTRMVPILELKPHPRNPNRHPQTQVEVLAGVISGNGWRCPVTVSNLSGFIVRGHARAAAAALLGLAEVPVDFQDYADAEQEMVDLVADNKIAELADMDYQMVADLIGGIPAELRSLTAYEEHEIGPLLEATWGGKTTPSAPGDHPKGVRFMMTRDEAKTVRMAIDAVRGSEGGEVADGRALELVCSDFLAGADH